MAIIEVNHVSKEFRLGQLHGIKDTLHAIATRLAGKPTEKRPAFKALDEVDFKVEQGEVLGIIGHNGAGKSTLLKILAGITRPTRGTVAVRGRVAPLIEVGAGLVPDLTGRENILLNAAILGMKRAEIRRKLDEIVSFAELEQFVDTPLKRYSSGMQLRLGFAIATAVASDILIVDEVLAVGDLAFQRKCFDRMEDVIRRRGSTVLIVSHNLRQVERLCSRVLLLERGRLVNDASATTVCNDFYRRSDAKIAANKGERHGRFEASEDIEVYACDILDHTGDPVSSIAHGSDLLVRLRFRLRSALQKPIFGVGFHTTDFVYLTTSHSVGNLELSELKPGSHELICRFAKLTLLPGVYSVRAGIAFGSHVVPSFYGESLATFQVISEELNRAWASEANEGFFALDTHWSIRSGQHDRASTLKSVEISRRPVTTESRRER